MAKTNHPNTAQAKEKRIWGHPDAVNLLISNACAKWTDEEIKELMHKYIEYCMNAEEGLSIEDFCWKHGIPTSTFEYWHAHKEWVKTIKDYGLNILISRRRDYAEFRKMDKELFIRHQHIFDPEYSKVNKYWQEMKTEQDMHKALAGSMFVEAAKQNLEKERARKNDERRDETTPT